MILNKRIGLCCLSLVLSYNLFAQPADNALWTFVGTKVEITRKIRIDLEEQVRFDDDFSHLNILLTEGGVRYELRKNIDIRAGFRYIYDPYSHNSYRYMGDISYSWSKRNLPLSLKYRLRFQNTIEEHTKETSTYLRNKIIADFNLSRFVDPYIAIEPYFKLNYINRFTVIRYFAGLDWRITKQISLDTYFMYEDEYGERNPEKTRVFGIGLTYDFKVRPKIRDTE